MNVTYSTTKPRKYDTKAIAKGKWLQALRNGAGTSDDSGEIFYTDLDPKWFDTELITLQKILQQHN